MDGAEFVPEPDPFGNFSSLFDLDPLDLGGEGPRSGIARRDEDGDWNAEVPAVAVTTDHGRILLEVGPRGRRAHRDEPSRSVCPNSSGPATSCSSAGAQGASACWPLLRSGWPTDPTSSPLACSSTGTTSWCGPASSPPA